MQQALDGPREVLIAQQNPVDDVRDAVVGPGRPQAGPYLRHKLRRRDVIRHVGALQKLRRSVGAVGVDLLHFPVDGLETPAAGSCAGA